MFFLQDSDLKSKLSKEISTMYENIENVKLVSFEISSSIFGQIWCEELGGV